MPLHGRATQKASRRPAKSRSKTKRPVVDPTHRLADVMAELMNLLEYSYMILLQDIYRSSRGNRAVFAEKCQRLLMPVMRDSEKVPSTLNYKPTPDGLNSSETLMPRHSEAHSFASGEAQWAYNRVSTVDKTVDKLWKAFSQANPGKQSSKVKQSRYIITGGAAPFAPGGPYLQRLTEKGDKPITGYDFAKALDEMMTMLSSIQYTKDFAGRPLFLSDVTRGLDWFRGNDWGLKYYVRNYWSSKFYSLYPPSINIGEIMSRWDNLVDYLNMYTDDKRIRREYANEMGYPVKETEKDRFVQAFARIYDMADRMFMQTRNKMNLRNLRI